jgi:aminoglycoside phosphotransferase family enzyme/predicted kinase
VIRALLSPSAYPHPADRVELIQTHISFVLLAGEYAYKIKKPLDLGFLDYSTLEKRRHFCEEEVRLNRRMCSDTYLGTLPVTRDPVGGYRLGGDGEPVEWAVQMRRLPADRALPSLLARGEVGFEMIRAVAHRVAEFHLTADTDDYIASFGSVDAVMVNWRENFDQTAPYIGRTVTREQWEGVKAYVDSFVERERPLFERRVQEGRSRDCHGDLRAEAIVFKDSDVCIYDCIEFNDRIRYGDVASDIAFLAMDFDFRGRPDLADDLLGLYLNVTQDATLPLVLNFYRCYRAYVRGKVDGFQIDQPEVGKRQQAAAGRRAQRYFRLAHAYATQRVPRALIIVSGLSGTGKSFVAYALASRLGAQVVSSDVTRKRLAGVPATEPHLEPWGKGIYDPALTERTYSAMLEEAEQLLAQGRTVILDATFLRRAHRDAARLVARRRRARFLALDLRCSEDEVRRRLSERIGGHRVVSDARWEIYQRQKEALEPLDEVPPRDRIVVHTEQPVTLAIAEVFERLRLRCAVNLRAL